MGSRIAQIKIDAVDMRFRGVYDRTYIIKDKSPKAEDFDKNP